MGRRFVAALTAVLTMSACGGAPTPPESQPSAGPPTAPSAATASPSARPPARVSMHHLSWSEVDVPEFDQAVSVKDGVVSRSEDLGRVAIRTSRMATDVTAGAGRQIDEVLVDDPYVVVVSEDKQEVRPARTTVIDLRSGDARELGGPTMPPLTHGGAWAIAEGRVAYPTRRGNEYCVATVALNSLRGSIAHCMPPRTGLAATVLTASQLAFETFDDRRPSSCRTVNVQELKPLGRPQPVQEARRCKAWDAVPFADGSVVWSEIEDEHRIEQSNLFVRRADGKVESLGEGATGTLMWCNDAAYFSRSPAKDVGSGQVLRWSPRAGLEEVLRTPRSAFVIVGAAQCSGTMVSVKIYGENSRRQLAATTS